MMKRGSLKIQKKVSGFFDMSWMGMEFKMSSFVPKEENGQRKILYTEIMEQQYEFQ